MNRLLFYICIYYISLFSNSISSSEKLERKQPSIALRKSSNESKVKWEDPGDTNDSLPVFQSKIELQPPISGKLVVLKKFTSNSNKPFRGLLLKSNPQTKVFASFEGTVLAIEKMEGYESMVFLEHPNQLITVYANLGEVFVKEGDFVHQGMELGVVQTEKNLYFQFNKGSKSIDPATYIIPEK